MYNSGVAASSRFLPKMTESETPGVDHERFSFPLAPLVGAKDYNSNQSPKKKQEDPVVKSEKDKGGVEGQIRP